MPALTLRAGGSVYYTDRATPISPFPPLVLLHGAGGSRLDWAPELRRLPNARILTLDLPGHGRSTLPARTTTRAYAKDVTTFMDTLALELAIMVGHSMGGAIAQELALEAPARVAGLILLGTGSKLPIDPALPQRALDDPDSTGDWIINAAWHPTTSSAIKDLAHERLHQTAPATLHADFLACQSFDTRARLNDITVPTLVMGATDDRMVKPAFCKTLADTIPNATLIMLSAAGHMFPLECGPTVAQHIQQWLHTQSWEVPCNDSLIP